MTRVIAALLVGSTALVAVPAFAADLPEPIPAAPAYEAVVESTAFDWTGAYVGGAVGYAFGEYGGDAGDESVEGFTGGVFAGYNYAVTPNWIVGAEADIFAGPSEDFTVGGVGVETSTAVFGTVRGRVGYAFDSFMVYGTGGLAVGWGEADFNGGSDSNTHLGWAAGGGVEAALTQNVTVRAEYLYVDTSEESYSANGTTVDADLDGHLVKVGVGYKF
ncbi:outer membrane protein [Chthonobacter rhizosphaerae]|uniref:outer membrane protein n=1 Tax=Chthonobacter rhizosphaerae TaxID=2735553 RepID=UPI0015EE584C|nr:outer membrane protein [Chthonobacter rhizosphaerae]